MKIVVDQIQEKPLLLTFEESVESFAVLSAMQKSDEFRFTGAVRSEIAAVREYGQIRVTGRAAVPVLLSCSRCLTEYSAGVEAAFTIFFRKESGVGRAHEDDVELEEDDLLSTLYSGDEIDLTAEIDEQVAMEIPVKPVCSDSCKGLCHTCGADLNVTGCTCDNRSTSFKFEALKNFKVLN
ncbi:MAG TPA: DUF177 domain-containing protein [Desulfuromonadales bacterium]|nr:DUF177 domain-containing protein [Desulfuromonadales bacterium]